ncbi:MAG: response regulator [Phaeodactylibacter sp.]|nr:response regulator [Phaeodactylibacter sp.]
MPFSKDPALASKISFINDDPNEGLPVVSSILQDKEGYYWFGAHEAGLKRYDPRNGQVLYFTAGSNGLTNNGVWNVFQSRDGTIWVATGINGQVFKFSPQEPAYSLQKGTFVFDEFKKTDLYRQLGGVHPEGHWLGPLSMAFDPNDESMWIRYAYGAQIGRDTIHYPILANYGRMADETKFYHLKGLNLHNLKGSVYEGNLGPDWAAEGLAIGKDGKIWGSYPSDSVGLFCFDPKTEHLQQYLHNPQDTNSLLSNYVTIIMMDSRGEIWAGQYNKGLSRFDPKAGKWMHFPSEGEHPNKIGGHLPAALMEGTDGRIWVGGATSTEQPFITIIDPVSNATQNISFSESAATYVRFFAQKEETALFAVDNIGIGILPPKTSGKPMYFHNSAEDNFPINTAASIVFDRQGYLWATSFDNAQMARLDIEKKTWFSFNNETNEPTLSRRGLLGPDGHVYFPNFNNGWEEINPKAFPPPLPSSSKLNLVDLYIKGERQIPGQSNLLPKPIWKLEQVGLSHQSTPFGFRFSSFHFRSPRVVYHYRLYPYETSWQILNGDPEVNYFNIPPGTYQFQARAYTMHGLLDEEGIDLTVVLHPPWWKTWWAYASYAAVFMALIAGLFLYQRRRLQARARLQLEREKAERLKEMDQFKSRFYTNITHEFRTPLTVIKGMAGQIEGNEKIKVLIQRNSERLLNMVNQLLDLSRLESNSLAVNRVQGDVIPYLQYLTESCHSLANDKHINLAFFSKEESLVMDYDETKLQHILVNLLSNAIKFTPEYGSVKVTVAQVLDNGKPFLELVVSDTGRGIAEEHLPNIFDRFYQAPPSPPEGGELRDSSLRRESPPQSPQRGEVPEEGLPKRSSFGHPPPSGGLGGAGIGLALVKELVQLLEGSIEVESKMEKGTKFTVMLPIRKEVDAVDALGHPATASTAFATATAERASIASKDKPLLLIIEDNADVIEYIISCLNKDYSLQTARNGKHGVEKALEIVPDVILCDVMMPEMDGFEACRILKSERSTSHIPIVLLTAKATQEDKVAGLSQGADAYLTKPFDKEELLVRLKNLAAVSQRLRERLSDGAAAKEEPSEQEQREAAFLKELHEIIENNMSDESFDTNRLCRAAAMSRTQLHRKLKALTGQATASFIRSIRLRKAKALLETTDLPIGDIAVRVGYKDFSHFSRSFGKEFGVLPSEVRKT